jgi:hypothetical protein
MNESKHTPGPWKQVGSFVTTEDETVDICSSCNVNNLPLEETMANANLIAAAPGLLAACKVALQAIRECDMEVALFDMTEAEIVTQIEIAIDEAEKGQNHE